MSILAAEIKPQTDNLYGEDNRNACFQVAGDKNWSALVK
jgi:hypothetical protein